MEPSPRTLHAFLRNLAFGEPNKKCIGCGSVWLSAKEILDAVENLAADYVRLGIRSGDYVGLRCHRNRDTIITLFALQAIGAVAVLTDPRQNTDDFLANCGIPIPVTATIDRFLLTDKRTGRQTYLNPFPASRRNFSEKNVDPKAPGFIIFTSGSTGVPKAVTLSQSNLIHNLMDSQPLGYYEDDDVALGALPLDHVFGLVLAAGVPVLGYSLYLPEQTAVPALLECIRSQGITRMNGVPSLYLTMAECAQTDHVTPLRAGFIGGGPCTPEQFRQIEEKLDITLIPVYGMSECIGISCGSYRDSREVRSSGVGPFYSMNTGTILLEDGCEAAPGLEGEICVRGPARMVGYYPNVMDESEFLHTGDLGYVDERGILHLTGRKKDIIIRNGVNLSPKPIEDALLSIPGVKAACVVGLPHQMQGEVPCAMVVGERSPMELFALLSSMLTKNQIPGEIYVVDSIPMTASGKPDKVAVREVLKQWIP